MSNKEKFIEVFGEEPQRQYVTKSWWEQEYVPYESEVNVLDKIRAEMEEHAFLVSHTTYTIGLPLFSILKIIDKYRSEKED